MDSLYVAYFLLHIVTTVAVDAAIALPDEWTLPFQRKMLDLHMSMNQDPLVAAGPAWLKAFIWVEILLQTPFFVWASYDLIKGRKRVWPAIVAYGVEAGTTTLACLAEIAMSPTLEQSHRFKLLALYFPYLVIPLALAIDFSRRIVRELKPKLKAE